MRKIEGYKEAQTYSDQERLPVGGYILGIKNVEYKENDWGDVIILSFDIEEGEFKGFFARNYKEQTGEDKKWKGTYRLRVPKDDGSEQDSWTLRRFKTVITNFEESNSGFHWDWDEQKLKGKKIGALFNNKEYNFNNRSGFFTNCHSLVTVEKIKSGKFEIPADTLLKAGSAYSTQQAPDSDGFMNIPDGIDEQLSFN